ncbi:hypothetical protein PR202_gb04617 [Eleusine coracana subsp. coracana]|uniref:Protein kinase domain-containing protein n=1 Tax=Eleusine coracana subsp. coracana TaxID=191504 RepID=A0AAV5E4J4_ELECO|nr:hypothetical protein PR202_gb04617 [Eleusine coracana subsp. coracana]
MATLHHIALLLLLAAAAADALTPDGQALLSFKTAVLRDPDGALADWNASDADPCAWNGVSCSSSSSSAAARRVVALSLPRKRLVASLPASAALPSSLRHLNLRDNRLFGPVPPQLLAGAPALQSLVLYGNALRGPLPADALAGLAYLQILDLSSNALDGALPDSILKCHRLRTLALARNNLTGPLPAGLGIQLPGLERLDLSYNRFSGGLPEDLGNLTRLQGTVDLSHNQFSGPIPVSLGRLPEKVYIDLTYNNLSGPIPQNGALENRGPTAFVGNPGLCGPPLKNPCSPDAAPSSDPLVPKDGDSSGAGSGKGKKSKGLGKVAIVAIVLSDVVGILIIALVFFYCYWRAVSSKDKTGATGSKGSKCGGRDCGCFSRDESETPSEQYDLVALDQELRFDLDELLKASAFVLGKSGIGIVYKVVLEDGLIMAVRRLGEGGLQRFKEFQTEVEAIGKVRHPNIVTLRAYYWSFDEKLLVYDYIPNGSLSAAIHGSKPGTMTFTPLPWEARLNIMKGVAKGMSFLHEFSPKKYVHGDLRPNNVLLGTNMEAYISDFGLGRLANIAGGSPYVQSNRVGLEKGQSQPSDASVSPLVSRGSCYQAPEALKTLKPSQKWDVYSYGVVLLEIITGRSPAVLLETMQMDLVQWVQFCIEEKKPSADVLDPFLAQDSEREDEMITVLKVALACVQANPEWRPSMRHVVETLERLNGSS